MAKTEDWQVFIPKVNPYPYEKAKRWASKTLAMAQDKVNKEKLKNIKDSLPLKTANYAVEMTFGKGRLLSPSEDQEKSPMDMILDLLKPIIDRTRWGKFRWQFRKKLLQQFEIIGWFKYDMERIAKANGRINQLVTEFIKQDVVTFKTGGASHLDFVPHPTTMEYFNSSRLLELRSKIYLHFTGKPLDLSKFQQNPLPKTPRQMDMHLDLQITKK